MYKKKINNLSTSTPKRRRIESISSSKIQLNSSNSSKMILKIPAKLHKEITKTSEKNRMGDSTHESLECNAETQSQSIPCNQLQYLNESKDLNIFDNTEMFSNLSFSNFTQNAIDDDSNKGRAGTTDCSIDDTQENLNRFSENYDLHISNIDRDIFSEDVSNEAAVNSEHVSPNCDDAQEYTSGVYRREVESVFNRLEVSVCQFNNTTIDKNIKKSLNNQEQETNEWKSNTFNPFPDDSLLEHLPNEPLYKKIMDKTKNELTVNPDFYGLPLTAKSLIKLYKNVDKLYDWQDECLRLESIAQRKNLIYALPTSGGKTLVAEILMLKEVVCNKKNVLFILPFVAIVQEKVWGLSPFAVALNFLVEEYAAGKGNFPPRKRRKRNSIYIATLEKGLGIVRSLLELGRLDEIGLVVIDELHLIGENSRGSTLEMLLSSVKFSRSSIQIIGMSATIGNIKELADFLNAEIYTRDFRPVELKEYIKVGEVISSVTRSSGASGETVFEACRQINYGYSPQVSKVDPDHLGGLVMEVIPEGSCLVFCATKKNCENVVVLLCRVISQFTGGKKNLLEYKSEEKKMLLKSLKIESGGKICNILSGSIPWGIAYHHSGLTAEERRLLEDNFRSGVLSVLCCTSTLAAGVNLPAQRVILRSPFVGRDFISQSTYKQMIGRAGRAGYGELGESILVCQPQKFSQVRDLLNQPMNSATSTMHLNNCAALKGFILSAVALNIANNRKSLQNLVRSTLLGIQFNRLNLDLKSLTDQSISFLFKTGAIEVCNNSSNVQCDSNILCDQSAIVCDEPGQEDHRVYVYDNSYLVVSKLGKAAIKGCVDLRTAQRLYMDLEIAQKSLVVIGILHLLYLVTPYEYMVIKPNFQTYYNVYSSLDFEGLQTAKILGLTESVAIKMITGKKISNVVAEVLNRFYVTLMLRDLWNQTPIVEVAERYQVSRGTVQTMMTSTATFACSVLRFCEELEQFWAFKDLLLNFTKRISHCCAAEILPLMDLPSVKKGRAMQLYRAGYKTIQDIAKANVDNLTEEIEHLSRNTANQLISSAKLLIMEKVENLREEAEDVMEELGI